LSFGEACKPAKRSGVAAVKVRQVRRDEPCVSSARTLRCLHTTFMQRIDDAEDRVVSAPESWRGESADMASLGRPFHIDVAVRRRELLPPELELKSRR
jgi:hypothetical protein